jgi:tRNA-dihydrouridine synthase
MKLDNIISVSGLPGLYNLLASRSNGLLIEGLDNKKRQFVSARKHQFTPLVSVGIYTYMDTVPLDDVFTRVHNSQETSPIPDVNDKADTLRAWFKSLVSDHDEDRVHINDIRKVIKWYHFLHQHAWDEVWVEESAEAKEEAEETPVESPAESLRETPTEEKD